MDAKCALASSLLPKKMSEASTIVDPSPCGDLVMIRAPVARGSGEEARGARAPITSLMREAGKGAVVFQIVPSELRVERGEARRVREVTSPKYVPAPLMA